MDQQRRVGWLGWSLVAVIALAVIAALTLPVRDVVAINLFGLIVAVFFIFMNISQAKDASSSQKAQNEAEVSKRAQAAQTVEQLVKALVERTRFSAELSECVNSLKAVMEKVDGTLEDAALVQEDLASLTPSLAELHDSDGPNLKALATEVLTLAQDSEAKVKTIAEAATKLLSTLDHLQREFASRFSSAQAAAQSCLAEVEVSRAALIEGGETVASWGRPADVIGQAVQIATDLAEQTRILGVNASIEALRSGEAGQGFMLIAEEAERLSDRMLRVAHQIASQIEEGSRVTTKLSESFSLARGAIERLGEASSALGRGEPLAGANVSLSPQEVDALLVLSARLSTDTRMLGGRLNTAFAQLDNAPAEEARNAATRLFDQVTRLAGAVRSLEPKFNELNTIVRKQETGLVEAETLGKELKQLL